MNSHIKRNIIIWGLLISLPILLGIWTKGTEQAIHWTPDYQRSSMEDLLKKQSLNEQDYQVIWKQTGLSKTAFQQLRNTNQLSFILDLQDQFWGLNAMECVQTTPVSYEERTTRGADGRRMRQLMAPLEDGDVLITPCSHTFGFRNGHAALVVSAKEGLTLESTMIGRDSSIQSIDSWKTFPCFMILRLKGVSKETRAQIARTAKESLYGVPYGLFKGIVSPKFSTKPDKTQCAHLVWQAYAKYGVDVDSNQGMIVTPQDIANSPLWEVIQAAGLNPQKLWSTQ